MSQENIKPKPIKAHAHTQVRKICGGKVQEAQPGGWGLGCGGKET